MDINAETCIKQGEELGRIAKKKSALKYQMQNIANNLIYTPLRILLRSYASFV